MVIIKKFNINKHLGILNSWRNKRELEDATKQSVPKTGFMVYFNKLPVVTGFLREVEGGFAMVDGYCTNPEAASITKHFCMEELTEKLIKKGKQLKYKGLIATAKDKSIIDRALAHGFIQLDQAVIVINLSKEGNK